MPFDPRVINNDDDFIPDDEQLEMLGAQLRDDAQHLANFYPAKKTVAVDTNISPPQPLRTFGMWPVAIMSAACLAIGLLASVMWRVSESDMATITVPEGDHVTIVDSEVTSPTAPVPAARPVLMPVVQQGFTGPEWEAVLDLLESDSGQEQSISL